MEFVPVAQAVTTDSQIPFAPKRSAIFPATIFPMVIGINKGDTFPGPFSPIFKICSSMVQRPPIPLPTITPKRFES